VTGSRDFIDETPDRVPPYVTVAALNERLTLAEGPFDLIEANGNVVPIEHGSIVFRWLPVSEIECHGFLRGEHTFADDNLTLRAADKSYEASVFYTLPYSSAQFRGLVTKPVEIGDPADLEVIRFSLANFPRYIGDFCRHVVNGSRGIHRGRLAATTATFDLKVDFLVETERLRQESELDPGFFISHVGELRPLSGTFSGARVPDLLEMLSVWFGFLRGARCGPLLPMGLKNNVVAWRLWGDGRIEEPNKVPTWLPRHRALDLASLFQGFCALWSDPAWRGPLKTAVSWYIVANASRELPETRIILSQVALEMLAWVDIVETKKTNSRSDFEKISAAGKVRALFQQRRIPCAVPDHMADLARLQDAEAFDGPGVITKIRNALVHSNEKKRAVLDAIYDCDAGLPLYFCSQLSLQYVELALLAICGYTGHYGVRGALAGFRGDTHRVVPWAV
jgi:hypothetical protein